MAMSRLEGCSSLTRRPAMRISPPVTVSSPAMVLSRVDFPQPEGPTRTRKPPSSISRSMPFQHLGRAIALGQALDFQKCHLHPLTAPAMSPRTK